MVVNAACALVLMQTQSLGMDTAAVGAVFAGMAAVNVLGAQVVANAADRFGPQVRSPHHACFCQCHLTGLSQLVIHPPPAKHHHFLVT